MLIVPGAQKARIAGVTIAPTHGGTVLAIGTEQAVAHRLCQANIAGEGAITGGNQHLLPITEIDSPPRLHMACFLGEACVRA